MTNVTPQLASAIHEAVVSRREDIVRLLVDLVSVPSVTFDEGAVQDVVERNYALRGLRIDRWEATRDQIVDYLVHVGEQDTYENRPNLVGIRTGGGGPKARSLMLHGHIDTVDNGDPALWTRNPLGEVVDVAERVPGPERGIAIVDRVDVPVQHQRPGLRAAAPGPDSDQVGAVLVRILLADMHEVIDDLISGCFPAIDPETAQGVIALDDILHGPLIEGHARHGDEIDEQADDVLAPGDNRFVDRAGKLWRDVGHGMVLCVSNPGRRISLEE